MLLLCWYGGLDNINDRDDENNPYYRHSIAPLVLLVCWCGDKNNNTRLPMNLVRRMTCVTLRQWGSQSHWYLLMHFIGTILSPHSFPPTPPPSRLLLHLIITLQPNCAQQLLHCDRSEQRASTFLREDINSKGRIASKIRRLIPSTCSIVIDPSPLLLSSYTYITSILKMKQKEWWKVHW